MPDGPHSEKSDDLPPSIVPRAYADNEPSCVRIAYLQAVLNNVIGHMPVAATTDNLIANLNSLDAAGVLPIHPRPVRTLVSAKRRLGIDPDEWITEYAICPRCWKHYHPNELKELTTPACTLPQCAGIIYEDILDAKQRAKRRPFKIIPHISLLQSMRRMLRRKGFRKLIRDSRGTPQGQNDDDSFLMTDMHDGSMWHNLRTNIKRETGDYGTVRDTSNGMGAYLTDHRFGLHMSVNLDWYVILYPEDYHSYFLSRFGCMENRPHSAGPVYVSFADLPRDLRFLQVNAICPTITPGPTEPTTEQLNHCLEPIVRDVCKLKNGLLTLREAI